MIITITDNNITTYYNDDDTDNIIGYNNKIIKLIVDLMSFWLHP
jgi:hypothetical protein